MMETFGETIREQGRTTNEDKLGRTWRKGEPCDSEADEEGELPQGANSVHLGGLVIP